MKVLRRLGALLCTAVMMAILIPFFTKQVSAADRNDDHVPKNVEVKLVGNEKDSAGNNWLLVQVSWDADDMVSLNELYPFVADASDGLYLIPSENGQSVGNKASGAPEEVQFETKDGRSYYTLKIRILDKGADQFLQDDYGVYAAGIKEGDNGVFMMTALVDDGQGAYETDFSNPVEFTYTEDKAESETVFNEEGEVKQEKPEDKKEDKDKDKDKDKKEDKDKDKKEDKKDSVAEEDFNPIPLVAVIGGAGALIGVGLVIGKKKKHEDCVSLTIICKANNPVHQDKMPSPHTIEVKKSDKPYSIIPPFIEGFVYTVPRCTFPNTLTDQTCTVYYNSEKATLILECKAADPKYQDRMPDPHIILVDRGPNPYTAPAPLVQKFHCEPSVWTFPNTIDDQTYTFYCIPEFVILTSVFRSENPKLQDRMPAPEIREVDKGERTCQVAAPMVQNFHCMEPVWTYPTDSDQTHEFIYSPELAVLTINYKAYNPKYQDKMPKPDEIVVEKKSEPYSVTAKFVERFSYNTGEYTFADTLSDQEFTFYYDADFITVTITHKALEAQYQDKMPPDRTMEVDKSLESFYIESTPVERFKPQHDQYLKFNTGMDDSFTIYYERNFVTITLECKACKPTLQNRMPAPQKIEVDKQYYPYTVTAPVVDKFTSREKSWTFNNVLYDQTHTFEYEAEFLNLTIHYKAKDAQYQNKMPAEYVKDIGFNDLYSVPSPDVTGFIPDIKVVSGEMCGEDVEKTVTYKKVVYTLNVFYESTDKAEQRKMPPNYRQEIQAGQTYSVQSPKVDGFTANIAVVSGTMEEKDVDYTVKYSKIVNHTVTFDVNGDAPEISPQKVAHNKTATKPADPVKEGFTFDGWYVDQALLIPYDFVSPVTADITLFARWK